jgi:hypothetical protein
MNYKFLLFFIFLILSFVLFACKQKEKEPVDQSPKYSSIERLSKSQFAEGDTIEIFGKRFGAVLGDQYLEFSGETSEDPKYLSWSDTLIKVIVPKRAASGDIALKHQLSNSVEYTVNRGWLYRIIDFLVNISLFITLIYIYLRINKIWKRKHEKEVADSQSLAGMSIYIVNCILWVSYYILVEPDTKSLIDTSIYIFEGSIIFLIGTGFWVKGQRSQGLWLLIKQALRLERKEADYLLKRVFKPQNAEIIISILHQLAMIDDELDDKEIKMIQTFAKDWNIDYSIDKLNKERAKDTENNFIQLRQSLISYLDREPPAEQAAHLKDMVQQMIKADSKITHEEELISDELSGIIETYLSQDSVLTRFHVIIVPQHSGHEAKILELLPDSVKIQTAGGIAYSIGTFYSHKYAEMICRQFRKNNLFTIVYSPEENDEVIISDE